ncbi:MAG TPA: helix-hairpin-helix domain-containing protein [Bacillota bacterium]
MLVFTFRQKIAAIVLLLLLALGGVLLYITDPLRKATEYREELPLEQLYVHICGAVTKPGVVAVSAGSRVFEAIAKAGGPLAEADLDQINLAAFVEDGEQIYLPKKGEVVLIPAYRRKTGAELKKSDSVTGFSKAGKGNRPRSAVAKPKLKVTWPLDVNQATREQLESVPGIGPVMAEKILAYRQVNGRFANIEEMLKVNGIGAGKLEKFRPYLCVK